MGRLIRRVLSASHATRDGHLSRTYVAVRLQRSTRKLGGPPVTLPVRPCSGRGLPSRPRHRGRWWSLTPPFHPYREETSRRSAFCCTVLAGYPGWVLPTALPCGARTFLGDCHQSTRPSCRPIPPASLRRRWVSARSPPAHPSRRWRAHPPASSPDAAPIRSAPACRRAGHAPRPPAPPCRDA